MIRSATPRGIPATRIFEKGTLYIGGVWSLLLVLFATMTVPAQAQSVMADEGGFRIVSDDGAYQLRIGGDMHADARFILGEAPGTNTSFQMRRARVRLRGTVYQRFSVQFMSNFGRGRAGLQDAFIDFRFASNLSFRAGKFKTPVGLEFLQSPNTMIHVERGYPTAFVPNRDVGFQLQGRGLGQRLEYTVGVFNGAPDGTSLDGDDSAPKDIVGRVFVEPWRGESDASPWLKGVGVGVGTSVGTERGDASNTGLSTYRTLHSSPLLRYNGGTFADGRRTRIVPQFYYYAGSLGLLGEYAWSQQAVQAGDETHDLSHTAWQVGASWMVTGEDASHSGISPERRYAPDSGGWGAVEVSAKVQRFEFDEETFPRFANPTTQVQHGTAVAAGLTWYPIRNVRFMITGERTMFGGNEAGTNRDAEHTLTTRVQIAY